MVRALWCESGRRRQRAALDDGVFDLAKEWRFSELVADVVRADAHRNKATRVGVGVQAGLAALAAIHVQGEVLAAVEFFDDFKGVI